MYCTKCGEKTHPFDTGSIMEPCPWCHNTYALYCGDCYNAVKSLNDLVYKYCSECGERIFTEDERITYGECPECGHEMTLDGSEYIPDIGESAESIRDWLFIYHYRKEPTHMPPNYQYKYLVK